MVIVSRECGELELNRKNIRAIMLIISLTVLLLVGVMHLSSVWAAILHVIDVFGVVLGGLGLAFVLNVPLKLFEERLLYGLCESPRPAVRKLRRPLALLLSLVTALGLVALTLGIVIPQLTRTISEIAVKLQDYLVIAMDWVERTLEKFNLSTGSLTDINVNWDEAFKQLAAYLRDGAGGIIGTATNVGTSVVSSIINFAFALIIAVYVLAQKERIGAFTERCMRAFLPEKVNNKLRRFCSLASETFSNFISGQLTDSLILGVLCYFGMLIFRFPYPGVIAIVIGVTSLVPMVGAFIGEAIGAFLIFFISPLKALLFIVFILCLQQVEGSFIYPRIVGKRVGMPGVVVLCAVIVGGNISGVFGSLLGVPVAALLYSMLRSAIDERLGGAE